MKQLIVRYYSPADVPHCSDAEAIVILLFMFVAFATFGIAVRRLKEKKRGADEN